MVERRKSPRVGILVIFVIPRVWSEVLRAWRRHPSFISASASPGGGGGSRRRQSARELDMHIGIPA